MPFRPLKALVNVGNFGDVLAGFITTTDNTAKAIASYGVPVGAVAYFSCAFVGRRTDGANLGDGAVLTLSCAYKNVGGVLTQIGTDTVAVAFASASINASAASSGTSGGAVQLKVAGVAAATINWVLENAFTIVAQ